MGPAFLFSIGVVTLRTDCNLTLSLLTLGNHAVFQRSMKVVEPMEIAQTSSSKCAARLKTLLVEYLLTQIRRNTGEETNPERSSWR